MVHRGDWLSRIREALQGAWNRPQKAPAKHLRTRSGRRNYSKRDVVLLVDLTVEFVRKALIQAFQNHVFLESGGPIPTRQVCGA